MPEPCIVCETRPIPPHKYEYGVGLVTETKLVEASVGGGLRGTYKAIAATEPVARFGHVPTETAQQAYNRAGRCLSAYRRDHWNEGTFQLIGGALSSQLPLFTAEATAGAFG